MAQVQDLRARNLELQRSQQELSQAVAPTAGISQSYGDQMTQILSTLAKFEAVVQGYHRVKLSYATMQPDGMVRGRPRSGMASNIAWHRRYNDSVD